MARLLNIPQRRLSKLVSHFYANMDPTSPDDIIDTYVKGVPINMSTSDLCLIMAINGPEAVQAGDLERSDVHKIVLETDRVNANLSVRIPDLPFASRLLILYPSHALFPHLGSFSKVTESDLRHCYLMRTGQPWDIGLTTISQMKHKSTILPFGMLITRILVNFGVPLTNEKVITPRPGLRICENTFHRMQWIVKDGRWISKDDSSDSDDEDLSPPEPPHPSGASSSSSSSSSAVPDLRTEFNSFRSEFTKFRTKINSFRTEVHVGFASVNTGFDHINSNISAQTAQITQLMAMMQPHTAPAAPPPGPPSPSFFAGIDDINDFDLNATGPPHP